jgi:hypothetical protein
MRRTGQVHACCSMKAKVIWASPRRCRWLFLARALHARAVELTPQTGDLGGLIGRRGDRAGWRGPRRSSRPQSVCRGVRRREAGVPSIDGSRADLRGQIGANLNSVVPKSQHSQRLAECRMMLAETESAPAIQVAKSDRDQN